VTPRSIQVVLRSLADAEPLASDGELLRRFLGGDEASFAELVRRHGRLVWAVCRHLTGSDAEADDAFQATFLVLLRGIGKIRDAGRLSAWLHGVAYRVCARARRAAKRRVSREQAAAAKERNGGAIADSAWDRALAAVHEEIGTLPETLRIPFVLCCLEGKGVSEAAEQLGWKLGTFSGRLTRAKDALLAKLDARGVTLGALAGLGLAAAPAVAVAKASALVHVGFVVPSSILQLTQGVIGMSLTSFKMLAAALLLTCGLGMVVGTGWMATADAQPPVPLKQPPAKFDAEAEVKRLQAELEKARLMAAEAAAKHVQDALLNADRERLDALTRKNEAVAETLLAAMQKEKAEASAKTAKWEYDFVTVSDMSQAKFVEFLQDRENRGWEFSGTTPLNANGKPSATWVFRRPAKGTMSSQLLADYYRKLAPLQVTPPSKLEDAKAIEAEIAKLHDKLAKLKTKPNWSRVVFMKADLPLPPEELAALLEKLAEKKFDKGRYTISSSENGIAVEGEKDVVEWVTSLVKKLNEK
jgi:RNA polymerase sigma factor (sigma-70 family)